MTRIGPKPFVFVLMPFSDIFEDAYKLGIKPACEESGAYCERVDEQIFSGSILDRIYNQISKADLIIADLTGRNPNVFYETGYAHALGKRIILLTQNADDIPFDLKHYSHIIYAAKVHLLKSELSKRVSWFLENPEALAEPDLEQIHFYISGQVVEPSCSLKIEPRGDIQTVTFQLDIHNPSDRLFTPSGEQIALMLSSDSVQSKNHSTVPLPDGQCLIDLGPINRILPGGWQSIPIILQDRRVPIIYSLSYHCELQILTPTSSRKIPFSVHFTP